MNAKLGHVTFLASYLILGSLGGVGWLLFGNGAPTASASGAIMGIMGVFVILFPKNDVTVLILWRSGGSFNISAYWIVGGYLIADLLGTLQQGQGVGYVAHLFGEIFGMAAGVAFIVSGFVQSTRYEENLLEMLGWTKKQSS